MSGNAILLTTTTTLVASGLLVCGPVAETAPAPSAAPTTTHPAIAGSASCRECHPVFHERWESSLHGASVVPVTPNWVRTNLSALPAEVHPTSDRYQLQESSTGLAFTAVSPDGREQRVRADFALGGRDLWYLLGALDDHRLQVLPLAFDRRRGEWFNPAASAVRPHAASTSSAVDWTSESYTFNGWCHSCNVSGFGTWKSSSTDSRSPPSGPSTETPGSPHPPGTVIVNTLSTRWWDEPGVRCETCHGPAADHVTTYRAAAHGPPPADLKILGLTTATPDQRNSLCASCHARRSDLTASFPPGASFLDHFDPLLLESSDFHVDGRARGETYTMTSWLLNPCAQKGALDCLHCHTSAGRDRFPGPQANNACLPCHQEKVADVASHSRHRPGEPGGRCIDCHMPAAEFARMRRRDHSFLSPTPSATIVHGSPNACNNCHTDRDAAWADAKVREWHAEDYQAPVLRRARWLERARAADWTRLEPMLVSLRQETDHPVYVASLLRLLSACEDNRKVPAFVQALDHSSPLVRAAAAGGLEGAWTVAALPALVEATGDPVRLVRVRAAQALATLPEEVLQPETQAQVNRAYHEFEQMLQIQPDAVGSCEALGHYHLDRGQLPQALAAFEKGLAQAPDHLALLLSAASVARRTGHLDRAERWLNHAVTTHPNNASAWFNRTAFLDLAGHGDEARTTRRQALRSLDPPGRREFELRWNRWRAHSRTVPETSTPPPGR